tara:strand:+ start:267 stop:1013 length:747 start_codon:yes stop_codon:yes gene_type:complete
MNLVFVRHGQSIWNLENKFTGWVDVGLSPNGIQEASDAGKTLIQEKFIPDICFTSFLKRSIDTAEILLNNYDHNLKDNIQLIKDWRLNERHYGSLQGLNKSETAEKYGEDKVHEWRRSFETQPPLANVNTEFDPNNDGAYKEINTQLPLGESLKDVVARVEKSLQVIMDKVKNNNVLVVAHGNSIRAILKIIENISDKDIVSVNIPTGIPLAFNVDNDKISRIGYLGEKEQIKKLQKEVEQQSRITKG